MLADGYQLATPDATPEAAPALELAPGPTLPAVEIVQPETTEPERVNVFAPDGTLGNVAAADLPSMLQEGYRAADETGIQRAAELEYNESALGIAQTAAEQAAQGATLGGYGLAAGAIDDGYGQRVEQRAEDNPITATAAQVAGAVAPVLLSGGTGAVGAMARVTPAALAEQIGARAGVGAAKYFGGSAAVRLGVAGAVEGGLGSAAFDAASGADPVSVLKSLGTGAAIGGALGAGFGVAEGAVGAVRGKLREQLDAFAGRRQAMRVQAEIADLHTVDALTAPLPEETAEHLIVGQGDRLLADLPVDQIDAEVSSVLAEINDGAGKVTEQTVRDINAALPKVTGANVADHITALRTNASKTAKERLAGGAADPLEAMRAARGDLDNELDDIAREVEKRRNRIYDVRDRIDTDDALDAKLRGVVERTKNSITASPASITSEIQRLQDAVAGTRAAYGDAALAMDGGTAALRKVELTIADLSPRIGDAIADGDLARAYALLDRMKRVTQRVAKRTQSREVKQILREKSEDFKNYLMDEAQWGDVAVLQREFNGPWSEYFLKSGDSDLSSLTKARSGDRAIDPFDTSERVSGGGMRSFLDGIGAQKTETAERAWRAELAADVHDLVNRSSLVGSEADQALARQAAEDAVAIDALSTRFAEINAMKPEGVKLAKLEADQLKIAEQESKELARSSLAAEKEAAKEAKDATRLATRDAKEIERQAAREAKESAREAREIERSTAQELRERAAVEARAKSDREDAVSTIGAAFGAAIGGAPGAAVGFALGKLPKIVRAGKLLLSQTDEQAVARAGKAADTFMRTISRGLTAGGRAAPAAAAAFSASKMAEAMAQVNDLLDPSSPASIDLQRKANRLDVVRPGLGAAYAGSEMARAEFIASKIPAQPPQAGPFARAPRMDPVSERKLQRFVAAAYFPEKALDRVANGTSSHEDREVLRILYPQQWARFVDGVEQQLSTRKKPPTYDERLRISYQLGIVTSPSTDPANLPALQAVADSNVEDAKDAIEGKPQAASKYRAKGDPNKVYGARTDAIIDQR